MRIFARPYRGPGVLGRWSLAAVLALPCWQGAARAQDAAASDLHKAARSGDVAVIQARLRQGVSPNVRDEAGRTPLMDAVAAAHVPAMRALIAGGADVNVRAHDGRTALIQAAADGSLDTARVLVESGADLNLSSRGWGTALKAAERGGHNDVAAMLLQAGAQSTGSSVGDTVCVRPWNGSGYCGTVVSIDKTQYRLHVTSLVGCEKGCPAKAECSAGRNVGGADGIAVDDEVDTVSWCLTHTGVKP